MDEKIQTYMSAMELYHLITRAGESREGLDTSIDHISKYMQHYAGHLAYELGKVLIRYVRDRDVNNCIEDMACILAKEIGGEQK